MDSLLGAVRSECERQRRRMAILGEMECLARQLDTVESTTGPDLKPAQVAPTRRRGSSRGPSRNPRRGAIRQHIAEHGPIGRGAINRALGGNLKSLDKHLQRLLRDGEIRVEGKQPHREYCASDAKPSGPQVRPVSTQDTVPTAVVTCASEDDFFALIARHGSVTTARLRQLTGLGDGQIIEWGRALARRRVVAFDGEGSERTWRPIARRNLGREIFDTVAADPGRFNDHRLALALRVAYERVALTCAELIDSGLIVLSEANTYLPTDEAQAPGVAS